MNPSRRRFLQLLGTTTVASGALAGGTVAQSTPTVAMGNNYFDPIGLHVDPGTTVRFDLAAGVHSATAYDDRIPDGAPAFDSGVISEGAFEHTFDTPGTYDYYCIPHEGVGMVGRIVVGDPGGPAEESPIPAGSVPDSDAIVDAGAIAYGASGTGGTGSSGGMMGGGHMGRGMWPNAAWGGGVALLGGTLGSLAILGGGLYWALTRGRGRQGGDEPAIAELRERYARGDLSEREFERRRERLEEREPRD